MVRSDQIPEHVWHTAMSTYHKTIKKRPGSAWQEAIAAALAAWPGARHLPAHPQLDRLILPLPPKPPATVVQYVTTADGQREAIYCENGEPGDNQGDGR